MSQPINIALIGNAGVGKTSYLSALGNNQFNSIHRMTNEIGQRIVLMLHNNILFHIVIHDFPGTEKYRSLLRQSKQEFDGYLIITDDNRLSFRDVPFWVNESQCKGTKPHLIIWNKRDVEISEEKEVEVREILDKCNVEYYCLSSKDKTNLLQPLLNLTKMITREEQ